MFSEIKDILFFATLFAGLYLQVFLLLGYFLWDGKTESGEDDTPSKEIYEPIVAIMVPCYNEELTVARTIQSLLRLRYPKEKLFVVVIDDGSTDNTWKVVQEFSTVSSVVLLQKQNEGSKYHALNYGLHYIQANLPQAQIIGCLDADSMVHPEALVESLKEFTKPGVMAVVPSMIIDQPKSFFQWMQKVEYEIATYAKQVFSRLNTLYIAPGPFTLFHSKVFKKLGDYNEAHHVEDMEIALRMQIDGMRLSHAIGSLVYTRGPSTWKALLKQRVRWTYGFLMNSWDYRWIFFKNGMGHVAVTIPVLFFMTWATVIMLPFLVYSLAAPLVKLLVKIFTTHQLFGPINFDLFYLNTDAMTILTIVTIVCLFTTILIGRKKLLRQKLFSIDLLTTLVYFFFAAWWTTQSAVNAVRGKKKSWR